jgi:hypothetical protein
VSQKPLPALNMKNCFPSNNFVTVLNLGEGVCADPVDRDTILEVKGPGPPSGVSERQLNPDRGGEKT